MRGNPLYLPTICLLTIVAVAPAPAAAARLFSGTSYVLGPPDFPRHVTMADLNRDGMDDLVVSLASGTGLAIAYSTGGGSFTPFVTSFPGRGDLVLNIADVDGDGLLDAAGSGFNYFGTDSSVVCVLYGDGNGGWVDSFQVRTPALAYGSVLGDLDGDGRADVIVALRDSSIAVYHANANRTLTLTGIYATAGLAGVQQVGDVLGTSAPDVLVAYSQDYPGVSIFEGNGDGTLGARSDVNLSAGADFATLAPIDSQPGLDLVMTGSGVRFSSGLGGGSFAVPTSLPSGGLGFGLVVADLDHDGKLDVASTNNPMGGRGIISWLGDGAGGFGPRVTSGQSVFVPGELAGGDVDEDGNLDLAYPGSFANNVLVTIGNGDGTFGEPQSIPSIPGQLVGLAAGDFDNDGLLDGIGSGFIAGNLAFAKGHGDGTFAPLVLSGSAPYNYRRLAVGRFDSDTNLDLVALATGSPSVLSFFRGHGDGTFDPSVDFPLGGSASLSITVSDLNGDGKSDVVVPVTGSNALAVLLQGPTGPTAPTFSPTPAGPVSVRFADLNSDGRLDRVVACAGQWAVQIGDGLGGYTTLVTHAQSPTPGDVALADFDEDGTLDAALTEGASSPYPAAHIHVWRGHPGGSFDSESIANLDWHQYAGATQPSAVQLIAQDFDADGHVDLVVRDGGNVALATVARGRGDRTFDRAEAYGSPYGSSNLAAGDFDGDGFADLLACGSAGSTPVASMVFLRNRSAGVTGVPAAPAGGARRVELAISSLAPNPSRGAFALEVRSEHAGAARVALYSPAGRIAFERESVALVPGSNRIALDAGRSLAPGVYWVRVTLGSSTATRKAVFLRD